MLNLYNESESNNLDLLKGNEDLSVGERFSLFFKEFSAKVDRDLASIAGSVHTVDLEGLKKALALNKPSYIKNGIVQLPTPEGFTPKLGSMMNHVERVSDAVFLVSSLKTESGRLYDWLKEIVAKGRVDKQYHWAVTDFDVVVERATEFLRSIPEDRGNVTYSLQQCYVNFEEVVSVVSVFNTKAKLYKTRDAEITSKEVSRVYDIGELMVKKIKVNDMVLTEGQLKDISDMVNKFIELTNITGAMLALLNETSKILTLQVEEIKKMR